MKFYPIILTRTCLPDVRKNREGIDYFLRVRPPEMPTQVRNIVDQIINEDHHPKMTQPRRVFWRTDRFIFWGLGMHNEWFLPNETMELLDMAPGDRSLRGFWGGFVEISPHNDEALIPLILSSLLKRPGTECKLSEDLLKRSQSQKRADSEVGETSFPPMEFVGSSSFCFPARLFQHFIQKDWTNFRYPVRKEDKCIHNQPIISCTPYDLNLFAPNIQLQAETNGMPTEVHIRDGYVQLLPMRFEQEEEKFWNDLILSRQNICVVSGLSEYTHVLKFDSLQVALMQNRPEREFIPKASNSGIVEEKEKKQDDIEETDEKEYETDETDCRIFSCKNSVCIFQWLFDLCCNWLPSFRRSRTHFSNKQGKNPASDSKHPSKNTRNLNEYASRKGNNASKNETQGSDFRPKNSMFDDLED